MSIADTLKASQWATLRELAEKAAPGPWDFDNVMVYVRFADDGDGCVARGMHKEDGAYIAAANPTTVLALLDEVERLRERVRAESASRNTFATGLLMAAEQIGEASDVRDALAAERERVRIATEALNTCAECGHVMLCCGRCKATAQDALVKVTR